MLTSSRTLKSPVALEVSGYICSLLTRRNDFSRIGKCVALTNVLACGNEPESKVQTRNSALTDKFDIFTDMWNENWDTRHANLKICDSFQKEEVACGEFPQED